MSNRLTRSERRELLEQQCGLCAHCGSEMHHIDIMPDDKNRDPRWACGTRINAGSFIVCRGCLPAFRKAGR